MNRRRFLPRAVLAAVLLVLPAAADAPKNPAQYERFDSDTLVIKDNFTKLEWDRKSVFTNVTFGNVFCAALSSLPGSQLPTVKELLTIVDEEPHQDYEGGKVVLKTVDAFAFGDSTRVDLPYWTSTPAPASLGPDMVWTVSFSTGEMIPMAKTGRAHARCVR